MKKTILYFFLIAILAAGSIGYYLYNKPHTNVLTSTAMFTGSSEEFAEKINTADSLTLSTFTESVVEVNGVIQSIGNTLTLTNNINCELDSNQVISNYTPGRTVTIKGIFSGVEGGNEDDIFADMLGESEPLIRLKSCIIIQP